MSQIHITDGQTDKVLDVITSKHLIDNAHRKSLKDTLETFDFITFADMDFSQYLGKQNRVIIPSEDQGYTEFVIHEAGKYRDTQGILKCEVYTSASYLLLKKSKIIYPQTLASQTTSTAVSHAIGGTEWQAGRITAAGSRTLHVSEHTNPYNLLKLIAREFSLELNFRVEIEGNRITGRYVDLLERVGMWQGREVEFGKDLIGIRRTEKTDNIVTALLGVGPVREDGTRLEVLVEDEEALSRWGRNGHHLIEVYEPQSSDQDMSLKRLTTLTQMELDKRVNAVVEYEADIADLEHVPGLENKKIRFGDTIKIKDTKFKPPLYLEARVHTQKRSITDKASKKVELGDFIEYTEEEVTSIWKSLQAEIRQKVSMMEVLEVTYTKQAIDNKDESVYQEGTYYADAVAQTAEEQAKQHAEQKANEAEQNAKQESKHYTDLELEAKRQALEAEIIAKANKVYVDAELAKKVAIERVLQIESDLTEKANILYVNSELAKRATVEKANQLEVDIANKADATWVNGQLVSKADKATTYTKTEVDNSLNTKVNTTTYNTDKNGIVTRLDSAESKITQNETEIATKVSSAHYNQKIFEIEGNIENKANASQVTSLETRMSSAETSITQQANSIALKANTTDVYTKSQVDSNLNAKANQTDLSSTNQAVSNLSTRISNAEAELTIQAGEISTKVSTTVYETGLATKENSILKQNTAPPHSAGILWLNTSVTPNILYRSTGSAWVKVTPTTAGEVGAYSATDGSNLAGRLSTAESTITQHGNSIALKASQTDLDTTNTNVGNLVTRMSSAESALTVQAGEIQARVTQTTYNAGIASKEDNIIKQNTAPTHLNGRLWLNTSVTPNVLYRSTGTAWVKATPTTASEVGAYSSSDGTSLAGRVTTAESTITQHAGLIASKVSLTDFNSLNGRVGTAESTITQQAALIEQRVTKTEFDNLQIGGRNYQVGTSKEYQEVTFQLWNYIPYTRFDFKGGQVVTASYYVQTTEYPVTVRIFAYNASNVRTESPNGSIVHGGQEGRAVLTWRLPEDTERIEFIVRHSQSSTPLHTLRYKEVKIEKGNKATDWSPAPEDVEGQVTGLGTRLSTAESTITQHSGSIALKANQTDLNATNTSVGSLVTRMNSAESALTVQAGEIQARVTTTKYSTDMNGIVTRLNSAESSITAQAGEIALRVTTSTYNSGMASKENTVFKQNTAPAHLSGRLWLDTSVTPNILYRSTGSTWVKATPTTAAEVGAYSSTAGNSLAGRVTTAEASITAQAGEIALRATKTEVDTLTGRVSTAESTITQHANQIALRVEKDGVIAAINLSPELAKIQAKNIDLIGAVTVLSDITGNLGTITAGTIKGITIEGVTITANSVFAGNVIRIADGNELKFQRANGATLGAFFYDSLDLFVPIRTSREINMMSQGWGTLGIYATALDAFGSTRADFRITDYRDHSKATGSFFNFQHDVVIDGRLNLSGILTGNGSGLTSLNATNLSSGTVNAARLPTSTSVTSTSTTLVATASAVKAANDNANTRLLKSGDAMSGNLTLGAELIFSHTSGLRMDQFGNFFGKSTATTGANWSFLDSSSNRILEISYGSATSKSVRIYNDLQVDGDFYTSNVATNFNLPTNSRLLFVGADGNEVLGIRGEIGTANNKSIRLAGLESYTTSLAANLYITSAWHVQRVTSARKYKLNEREVEAELPHKILNLTPKSWFDKRGTEEFAEAMTRVANGEEVNWEEEDIPYMERVYGLIAEDLEAVGLSQYVSYGEVKKDGTREIEGIMYDRLWTLLIPIVREQQQQIEKLTYEVALLKAAA